MLPVSPIGGEWSVGQLAGSPGSQPSGGGPAIAGTTGGTGGFGGTLAEAISSLEQTQQSADSAAQGLATGTINDPESAVIAVKNAQMAMELAAQIRTKATEAVQSVFQTQV